MAKIRVLVIEDNRLLREDIAAMLGAQYGFEAVAVAEDGDAIERLTKSGQAPDVILPEQVDIVEFVQAGGSGFILKSASSRISSIRSKP